MNIDKLKYLDNIQDKNALKRVKSYDIPLNNLDKQTMKLARNRESARNSRKRKKIYI